MISIFEYVGHRTHTPLRTLVRSVVFASSACSKIELMFSYGAMEGSKRSVHHLARLLEKTLRGLLRGHLRTNHINV